MAVIKVNSSDVDLFARLLRGEEELGQLMVGNVGVTLFSPTAWTSKIFAR
ncbi:UNVERIFIED_CONTAM: spore germination cell wall hydrolase CwlJ-like protein [Brevibacillus sp. OAP136]